jgi:type VI secretion system lysozyme-like protein
MSALRLLERLQALENPPEGRPDEATLERQSIFQHVKRLLSTHKGTVPISDDYGMPDVFFSQGIDFKQSSQRMRTAIAEGISRFETRLSSVKVEPLSTRDELLKQRFRILAVLTRDHSRTIEFTIEISSEAKITIIWGNEQQ